MARQPFSRSNVVNAGEHHLELRDSVAKLAGSYGRSYFQDVTKRGAKPDELWADLGANGFLGVHMSEEYGGGGGGMAEYNVVVEEVAAQGCPLFSLVLQSICAPIIERYGSTEQKERWVRGLASGELKISFGITEPDAGTNTHKISTTATPDGDGWVLDGAKYWTSALDEADAVLVVARGPEPDERGRHPLSLFLVPPDAPGLTMQPIEAVVESPDKQFMTFFDGVALGPESLVGIEGEGLRQVFSGLNPERVAAAALNNGIACFAIDKAVEYASSRVVWDVPIGQHQGVAHPLAEAAIEVQQARLMTARAAELFDAGQDAAEASNMAKFAAADSSLKALDQAIQIHGGNGFSREYALADLWFIARVHRSAPVSREMVLNHVAQHTLGLPKSY
jgi:alkylation response protein AidB-like acyl-CoA dehydrogenase